MTERKVKATDTRCPVRGCSGALCNVSSRLAEGMGVMTLKCDKCGKTWGVKLENRR